ncbi:amidohydrolase family protein [Xiamenia xianingshaonis]|uniref:Amidohydrolase n=1 Tax=Xiamenia xianingshaonis TaxID=2682776 RepID=A0A9E6MRF6_9ACTN|nr:amidohydrolase [Xiamenia xianingshaonis]NHM13190.1 amidohydrolase family protein [Xiamenia xianingshaonis]QTU84718.1 amidohydrolase [Xiamenia xianingshaonis]
MLFANIALVDDSFQYREGQWVGVRDGVIAYVGDEAPESETAAAFGEVYDGTDRLLMPAFYNAHSHAPMTLLRGYAENLPLQAWLNDAVFPFEAKITPEDCYWATMLACAEMARFGVVSFSDMYYHMEMGARAVLEAGMKANLSDTLIAFGGEGLADLPLYEQNEMLLAKWHGAGQGRVLIDCNIHAEYTTNPGAIRDVVAYAKAHGLRIQVHVSETKLEHEECRQRRGGMTPVAYLDSLGVFDVPCTAAHCVWVDGSDIETLVEKGVFVAANPASNMKLGSGFAPYGAMLDAGVRLCLGTDGMASNNSHDLMQDMYLLALAGKGAALDPAAVTPQQAIRAATREGALSQGRADCGLVKQGMRADLCVLDVSGPSWAPMTNPLVNLVYSGHGSDVALTMCDGEVVYRDGAWPTIDVARTKAEVSARTRRIQAELAD